MKNNTLFITIPLLLVLVFISSKIIFSDFLDVPLLSQLASVSTSTSTTDTKKPTTPGKPVVSGSPAIGTILSWTPSTDNVGVIGYNVFRNNKKVGIVVEPKYIDTSLIVGTTYTFKVSAYDKAGNTSNLSQGVSFKITKPYNPPATTTPPVVVTDTIPPTLKMLSPLNGVTMSGTFVVAVEAKDNVGIASVKMWRDDGISLGTFTATSSDVYSVYLEPSQIGYGSHTFYAQAVDTSGNITDDPNTITTAQASFSNGLFTATFGGVPGKSYNILKTTNLSEPRIWSIVATKVAGIDGTIPFSEPLTGSMAFYKIEEVSSVANGLNAYWNFENVSGTTVPDASGNNRLATLVGAPSVITGLKGNSLELIGSGAYVNVPSIPNLTQFSISAWVNPSASQSGWESVVIKQNRYGLEMQSGRVYANIGDGTTSWRNTVSAPLSSGVWHHVVQSYDGTNNRLYIDGVLSASGVGALINPTSDLLLGSWNGTSEYFNGKLDEIRIYNRAITSTEVQTLYTSITPPTPPPATPTATLTASPNTITAGSATTLTWASTNATSCTGTGGAFAGSKSPSGSVQISPTITTSYSITCVGAGGNSNIVNVTVTVGAVSMSRIFYIDYISGNDSLVGNSISSAWKRHPYMIGFAGVYSHQRGDRFIFKGGVTWPNIVFPINIRDKGTEIGVQQGGTITNPDYYGVDISWFNSSTCGVSFCKPIFAAENKVITGNNTFIYGLDAMSNVVIDNIEMKDFYWVSGYGTSYVWLGTSENVIIKNSLLHNWTHASYSAGGRDDLQVVLGGGNAPYSAGSSILNTTIDGGPTQGHNNGSGMAAYHIPIIKNSIIKNVSNGLIINGHPAGEVAYSDIGPVFHSFSGLVAGNNQYHENSIEAVDSGTFYIHHNYIHDELPEGGPYAASMIFGSPGDVLYFYDNVVWNTWDPAFKFMTTSGPLVSYIWNNTFDSSRNGSAGSNTGSFVMQLNSRNNHFIAGTLNTSNMTVNANINNLSQTLIQANQNGYSFVNNYAPTNSMNPTVNTGALLTCANCPDFNKDILGNIRPLSGPWDIGAYQYVGTITPPVTSTGIWYVDGTLTTGLNNGTSWANAWRSFDNVVWGTNGVGAGNTLYISGGNTSKTYSNKYIIVGASGTANAPITIRPGQDVGHNGLVIFDYSGGGTNNSTEYAVDQRNTNYIVWDGEYQGVSHIKFQNLRNILARHIGRTFYNSGGDNHTYRYITFNNMNNGISEGVRLAEYNRFELMAGDYSINATHNSTQAFDQIIIRNNFIESAWNNAVAPGGSGNWTGPDGIWADTGVTVYNNIFKSTKVNYYTSDQHTDYLQTTGNYVKVFNNEFINIGDSAFDYGVYANTPNNPHDIWIYNNLFRTTDLLDPYPEYFRFYGYGSAVTAINNLKILNNTFADSTGYMMMRFDTFIGNPTASGVEIKNNIFQNIDSTIINIANSTGFDSSSFSFGNNIYSPSSSGGINYRGVSYTIPTWISGVDISSKSVAPMFSSYTAMNVNNDFHLLGTDTGAQNAGANLSAHCSTVGGSQLCKDKDGNTRPSAGAWDIGAYEYIAPVVYGNQSNTANIFNTKIELTDLIKKNIEWFTGLSILVLISIGIAVHRKKRV